MEGSGSLRKPMEARTYKVVNDVFVEGAGVEEEKSVNTGARLRLGRVQRSLLRTLLSELVDQVAQDRPAARGSTLLELAEMMEIKCTVQTLLQRIVSSGRDQF